MRFIGSLITVVASLPLAALAQDTQPNQEYAAFSKLIHGVAVKQMPKQFEDDSGWGQMTEVPTNLPLFRLRKVVKVKDHFEAPHGAWRRFKGKIENPNKNLKIVVKEFKKLDANTYRVVVDVDATVMIHADWQQWQKGLMLIGASATVDANITAAIVCDVGASLTFKDFTPELKLDPKVTKLGLDFIDFKVRGGPFVKGEAGDSLRNDLKDVVRTLLKASEPFVKDEANRAIAQSLKEGKGTISAGAIMKALPTPITKDKK